MSVLFILIGLVLLVVGGEYLVRSSVALSFKLKLSKMVIGLTVVSFATSAPELLVSVNAALGGHSDISLGNVIGSNIANIGLVLGITAVITPLAIDQDFYKFNWPVMMFLSVTLFFLLTTGKELDRLEGGVLLILLLVYLFMLIRRARIMGGINTKTEPEGVDDALSKVSNVKIMLWLFIGGLALWGGSELLVNGAVDLATKLGVSERVISVTMIAVGTSVPELAASVIAALKKEKAISLGNLIGSNIFNIASVLGITALIQPITVKSEALLSNDIFWMLGFAAVLIPLAFLPRSFEIGRYKGVIIVTAYALFISLAFIN
ncbi:MAG: calcium/sodium antiporter [Bacteroidia bacterium]|nr:calcium/sodium antiporter [Bacteroidia bacterium]NNF30342.1 calcium/sodium antiporter [Flavobacteriaceae bacterium]MBT8276418.1 calcium/sodium antiporter [Bacteroidia bacterium]NNJ80934.1 calcium/sodium antiporter [Flavobacteriaceae bacterium]NNK53513.1 calcium/sodium antiporter [Flavobacteriaceae bacterium]